MRCDEVAALLPMLVDASVPPNIAVEHHVESCLRCQAELARYRRLVMPNLDETYELIGQVQAQPGQLVIGAGLAFPALMTLAMSTANSGCSPMSSAVV